MGEGQVSIITDSKINSWGQFYKNFLSAIYEFLYQARVFVRLEKLDRVKHSSL
jgi:hypothetical protein